MQQVYRQNKESGNERSRKTGVKNLEIKMVEEAPVVEKKTEERRQTDSKPKGSVRVCIRVRPQLKREVVYRQVVEAVSVS